MSPIYEKIRAEAYLETLMKPLQRDPQVLSFIERDEDA